MDTASLLVSYKKDSLVDKSEESTLQRDLLLSFLRNPNESNSATTTIETDVNEFNNVTVMTEFNALFSQSMQNRATQDSQDEETKHIGLY